MHYLQDHRWRLLKEQRNDCSTYSGLDLGESKTTLDATGSQTLLAVWNIPLYNANGDASETTYMFYEIIPKNIWMHLQIGRICFKRYKSFVLNCVTNLHELQVVSLDRF